jgi:hypothetical protein
MAFNLSGTIVERLITDLFIPRTENALVSRAFVTAKSGVKAESIKIWGVGSVTVADYAGGVITGTDHVDTSVLLTLNKAKYFRQNVEKIDNDQSAINVLSSIIPVGAYELASVIDKDTFAELATTTNTVPTVALDETNVAKWVRAMGVKLTKQGAPRVGRALAVNAEIAALLAGKVSDSGNDAMSGTAQAEGFVGRFAGFDIYESENIPVSGLNITAIASVPRSTALGLGFNQLGIDAIPGQFFDAALGLVSYGLKLVQNDYVCKSVVTIA